MITEERLLKVLFSPYISEKASSMLEKNNVVVFNVNTKSTKKDIKCAAEQLFSVVVHRIHTVNVKKKIKKRNKNMKTFNKEKVLKKAYITLGYGQKINFPIKLKELR